MTPRGLSPVGLPGLLVRPLFGLALIEIAVPVGDTVGVTVGVIGLRRH
jgi:hypothetical protein